MAPRISIVKQIGYARTPRQFAVNVMNDYGPSSVTIEEAVAKMIGFEVLPENITLLDALRYMVKVSEEDFFNAQEEGLDSDTIKQFGEEFTNWQNSLFKARDLLADIGLAIQNSDSLLIISSSDTCRVRLATQSVYTWAKYHHGIEILDWKEFRGLLPRTYEQVDKVKLEGEHLFESLLHLTDELLLRDWSGWKGNTPDLSPRRDNRFFKGDRENKQAIAREIEKHIIVTDDGKEITRTIYNRICDVIDCLRDPTAITQRSFEKREFSYVYKILVGLYRLLSTRSKARHNQKNDVHESEELDIHRFVKSLIATSGHISDKELENTLIRALGKAKEKNF